MYAYPVLLPAITNREDFLRTVSLFDDDTGQAIDVSGRTLANPGDFTAAAWTVTSGLNVSASVTSLTIKDYPFGNEMQAIALTIGSGLTINPGDPVTIADTATGKNTMTGFVTSYVAATGAMVAQIGCAFDFEMRGHHHHEFNDCDYGSSSGIGTDISDTPVVQAQLGSGITVVGLGVVQVRIPASTLFKTRHRTYSVAMAVYLGGDTRQILLGKQPILYGGLSTMPIVPAATSNPFGLP
jgi:hypothetical protein